MKAKPTAFQFGTYTQLQDKAGKIEVLSHQSVGTKKKVWNVLFSGDIQVLGKDCDGTMDNAMAV
jgi:hypothetical protein